MNQMNNDKLQDVILKAKKEVAASFGMTWDRVINDRSIIDGALDMVIKRVKAANVYDSNATLHIACYDMGNWDSYHIEQVFASHDIAVVQRWVDKFNRVLSLAKELNNRFEHEQHKGHIWIKDEYYERFYNRWRKVNNISSAFVHTLKMR